MRNLFYFSFMFFVMIVLHKQNNVMASSSPTIKPSIKPSTIPSRNPSRRPSRKPTSMPSSQPTSQPSSAPSGAPTSQPSRPTVNPSTITPTTVQQYVTDLYHRHYTPGHIAGAVMGTLTICIVILLCVYDERNKRAYKRDMRTFYGESSSNSPRNDNNNNTNQDGRSNAVYIDNNRNQRHGEVVYNPMI